MKIAIYDVQSSGDELLGTIYLANGVLSADTNFAKDYLKRDLLLNGKKVDSGSPQPFLDALAKRSSSRLKFVLEVKDNDTPKPKVGTGRDAESD